MKKICILVVALIFIAVPSVSHAEGITATFAVGVGEYEINGTIIKDTAPYIKSDRMFLPIRYVAYAMGLGDDSIEWDPNEKIAYLLGEQIVAIPIGRNFIVKGTEVISIDVPGEIVTGRTMLPLRAVSEAFGVEIKWDEINKQAIVLN